MSDNENFDKLTELLEAFDACDPGSPEAAAAWNEYLDAWNEAKAQQDARMKAEQVHV